MNLCIERNIHQNPLLEKLAICYKYQQSGQATVSCIMRGLSQELRANTLACQYRIPDKLYEDFLSAFDSYQFDLMNIIKYRTILLGHLD